MDKNSYKRINIYYTGYITKKDSKYVSIHSANPLVSLKKEIEMNTYILLLQTKTKKY